MFKYNICYIKIDYYIYIYILFITTSVVFRVTLNMAMVWVNIKEEKDLSNLSSQVFSNGTCLHIRVVLSLLEKLTKIIPQLSNDVVLVHLCLEREMLNEDAFVVLHGLGNNPIKLELDSCVFDFDERSTDALLLPQGMVGLTISYCHDCHPFLSQVAITPTLHSFTAIQCFLTTSDFEKISLRFPHLKELGVCHNDNKVDDEVLSSIRNLKSLQEIWLDGSMGYITSRGLEALGSLSGLEQLGFTGCHSIRDNMVQDLAKHLTKLKFLRIESKNLSLPAVKELIGMMRILEKFDDDNVENILGWEESESDTEQCGCHSSCRPQEQKWCHSSCRPQEREWRHS